MLKKRSINLQKKTVFPRIIVVMPAYNAEKTLEKTVKDFPPHVVTKTIIVDDGSTDKTVEVARKLGLQVIIHEKNQGYGGNQKTCYKEALKYNPDVVIMIHPDYQYDSSLIYDMVKPILERRYDMMYGNRIRTRAEVLAGGMPPIKYILNRFYCIIENMVLGANFSEYFSGMRAYSKKLLNTISFEQFSNDFVFDQEMMIVSYAKGFRIGEIDIPVRYFSEASSIQLKKGAKFLIQTLEVLFRYILYTRGNKKDPLFKSKL